MKRLFTLSLLSLICFCTVAQTVTFTGRDASSRYVQLNRVVITNHTKGWQETIFWPDTTLTKSLATQQNVTGIDEFVENGGFVLSQNNPNPFNATTDVYLNVAEKGTVTLMIADMNGRVVRSEEYSSQSGVHHFRVSLANAGMYVMTAR